MVPSTIRVAELEQTFGVRLSAEQKVQIRTYLALLKLWNRKVNLTRLQSVGDQLQFHFFESFWAADRFLSADDRVADVGTGAGFPGLALKLFLPSIRLTLIEKSARKVVFLKEVCRALSLPVEIFQGFAEGYEEWGRIDVATLRALVPAPQLIERFRNYEVLLLLLHGTELADSVQHLELVRRHRVPGSDARYASLFRCL